MFRPVAFSTIAQYLAISTDQFHVQRTVQPEILDGLQVSDPRAVASRRDLQLYNRLMANFRWFADNLQLAGKSAPILEVGAGDGSLAYFLDSNFPDDKLNYSALDRLGKPENWPTEWQWIQSDLIDYTFNGDHGILLANLILHHFEKEDLLELGRRIRSSSIQLILINEPARKRFHFLQVALSRLLGVHPVTLHDARVSIRAGFRGDELAGLLELNPEEWMVSACETFMGANRLICQRK